MNTGIEWTDINAVPFQRQFSEGEWLLSLGRKQRGIPSSEPGKEVCNVCVSQHCVGLGRVSYYFFSNLPHDIAGMLQD